MLNKQRGIIFVLSLIAAYSITGCGRHETPTGDNRIIARVNSYEMTVADFKEGLVTAPIDRTVSANPAEAKKEAIEGLITKRLLLQEAQKEDFDKERGFMKEIERRWEQALLKLLFKKKSYDLARGIRVEDVEMLEEYRKMKRKLYADIVILKDRDQAERLSASGDKFDEVKESLKDTLSSGRTAEWCSMGDLPKYLEDPLFSLMPGEASQVIKSGNHWAVIRVIKEEETDIGPFEKVAPRVREYIMKRKKEEAFEKWMADLRKKANVKIDYKLLDSIETK